MVDRKVGLRAWNALRSVTYRARGATRYRGVTGLSEAGSTDEEIESFVEGGVPPQFIIASNCGIECRSERGRGNSDSRS